MQQTGAPPATLDAVLERITYATRTPATVARVATDRSSELLTVVCPRLVGAQPGESLRLRAAGPATPQVRAPFQVDTYQTMLPAMAAG
jgi:exodeoxyribonuclease V alpha subunit